MTRSVETPEDGARNPKRRNPAGVGETVPEGYGTHETYRTVSDTCCVYRGTAIWSTTSGSSGGVGPASASSGTAP